MGAQPRKFLDSALQILANAQTRYLKLYNILRQISRIIVLKNGGPDSPFPLRYATNVTFLSCITKRAICFSDLLISHHWSYKMFIMLHTKLSPVSQNFIMDTRFNLVNVRTGFRLRARKRTIFVQLLAFYQLGPYTVQIIWFHLGRATSENRKPKTDRKIYFKFTSLIHFLWSNLGALKFSPILFFNRLNFWFLYRQQIHV